MKRLTILSMLAVACAGCNFAGIDTELTYDTAIIGLPDGSTKTVRVKSWCDYGQSDMVRVTASDGTIYRGHAINIILIKESDR